MYANPVRSNILVSEEYIQGGGKPMREKTLTDFFAPQKALKTEKIESPPPPKPGVPKQDEVTAFRLTTTPTDLPPSYFVSATYSGEKGTVCIKIYEPASN